MSADEAFDNLMNKNAFAIPVAGKGESRAPEAKPAAPDAQAAMRVADLFDDVPADYTPRKGFGPESERSVYYNHPTETELEAVAETEELANAHLQGARIVGQGANADGEGEDEIRAYRRTDTADAGEFIGGEEFDPRLGETRRVRRFAYLPVAGAEAFERSARDMVAKFAALAPERPSLVVTGARRGEGRSELAMRLALALARRVGYRVLLADFDVRKPDIAARLGVSSKYFALADVLRGSCPLGEALVASEEDNLYVLPARLSDRDGDEVLDSRQVETLLAGLHGIFDFTIIDCGPVTHADAFIVCKHAGSVVLAGRCGVSSAAAMREAGARLESAGARVAGMLLAGA